MLCLDDGAGGRRRTILLVIPLRRVTRKPDMCRSGEAPKLPIMMINGACKWDVSPKPAALPRSLLNLASPVALGMTITLWSTKATIKDDEW